MQLKRQKKTDYIIEELEKAADMKTPSCDEYDIIYPTTKRSNRNVNWK